MSRPGKILVLMTICLPGIFASFAQDSGRITVTYVTSKQVYFDAGTEQGVAIGDTIAIFRSEQSIGKVVITAVASHSSVGRLITPQATARTGDKGIKSRTPGTRIAAGPASGVAVQDTIVPPTPSLEPGEPREKENILTGRIGLQFTGEWAEDSRLNVAQPAALAYLHLRNLLGTGMTLSFGGREYYEMTGAYARYGDSVRSRFDMYEFQLERDRPGDWYGFSAGRMVSRYVSGLGTLDGGQVLLRTGAFSSGALIGKGIKGRALGNGGDDTRTAVFVGFHDGDQALRNYDASIAYARQTVGGSLDRSFVYMQGSAMLGPEYTIFGNAEVDLNDVRDGQRVSATRLTSAMFYVNYWPSRWLSASLGYDGTRSVYLFETMKSIPDSLFKESLRHGFRARATFRPLAGIVLTGAASFGTRKGDPRNTRTFSGDVRFLDIFDSDIHASIRYVDVTNLYLRGTDIAYELEKFFLSKIDLLLRYDIYAYSVTGLGHAYRTQTISTSLNWYLSRSLYSTARGDYVIDDTMNSARAFIEVGLRF